MRSRRLPSLISAAYCYIRKNSPENAVRWRQGFYEIVGSPSRFPDGCSFALENEAVEFDVRQKLYGNNRILFTVERDRVIVLNVRHAARRTLKGDEMDRPEMME